MRRASGVHALSPRRHRSASAAGAPHSPPECRRLGARRAVGRPSRSSGSPSGGTRHRSDRPSAADRSVSPVRTRSHFRRHARADAPETAGACRHRPVAGATASVAGTRRVGSGIPEAERRETGELLRELEREIPSGDDSVDCHDLEEIAQVEMSVSMSQRSPRRRLRSWSRRSRGPPQRDGRRIARGSPSRRRERRGGRTTRSSGPILSTSRVSA